MHSPQYAIEAGGPPPVRNLDIRPTAPPAPVEEEDEEEFLEGDLAEEEEEEVRAEETEAERSERERRPRRRRRRRGCSRDGLAEGRDEGAREVHAAGEAAAKEIGRE